MLYLGTTPLAGMIKTKLFTASGTFVVPSDVYVVWVDGCGGGGGGGGGNPTPGGGGGGGGTSLAVNQAAFPVTPGETLTVTVGAAGPGGAAGVDNGLSGGGNSSLISSIRTLWMLGAARGGVGANPNGGSGASIMDSSGAFVAGGAGTGTSANRFGFGANNFTHTAAPWNVALRYTQGAAGGALPFAGGANYAQDGSGTVITNAAGNASGGGGGAGACGLYGLGGAGGANGAVGSAATGYGCGGGGGSGNAAGGNGSPGFVRIYYISKYTVA